MATTMIGLPTVVVALLLLAGLTTRSLCNGDGNSASTTSADVGTTTSTLSRDKVNITTSIFQGTSQPITSSTTSHVSEQYENVAVMTSSSLSQQSDSQQYDNSSVSTKSPAKSQQPRTDRPSEPSMATGLHVLYRMTSTFLDVIQPPGKNLYDELQMQSTLKAKPSNPLGAISESFSSKAQDDPKFFIRYLVGFAVCVAFGVVFIVVMPLVGLLLCICRCCGHRCGHEKTGTPEEPNDKPKRICLGISLFFLAAIILAGTVCAFMSNELMRRQTASKGDAETKEGEGDGSAGLIPTILNTLGEIETFKQSTVKEFEDLLVAMNFTLYEAVDELRSFPDVAADRLRDVIGTNFVEKISTLNYTLFRLVEAVRDVDADSVQLRTLYSVLNQSLTTIQRNLTELCHSGNMSLCQPPDLTIDADLNQIPNISSQLTDIDSVLNQGITFSIFDDISRKIRQEFQSVSNDVLRFDISGTLMNISSSVKSATDSLDMKPLLDSVNRTRTDVDKYGNYRFYVCVAISAFLLLVVLLIFVGLCIGACTKPPYDLDSTSGVTRWTASHFLMASVVIMYVFCSVLMAIVTVLFVSGGVVYTEGCRGLDEQQDVAIVKIADELLRTHIGNVTFYQVLRDCKQDVGIVKALNLDEKFHINDRFNLSNLKDLDFLNRINLSSIDLSQLQFSNLKNALTKLRNSSLLNISLTAYNEMLNESRTRSSLTDAIRGLNKTAQDANETNVKNALLGIVEELQNLADTVFDKITNKTEHFRIALRELNETLYVENSTKTFAEFLTEMVTLLERTENRTRYEAPKVLQQLVEIVASNLLSAVVNATEETKTRVLTSVGPCSPISNAIENTVAAICHSTLNPYNAFWFSYGWCIFIFIPTIAIAMVLAQLCWRLEMPLESYSEIPGYDAYKSTYPEEYLRLHNLTTSRQERREPDINGASREPLDSAQPHGNYAGANNAPGAPYATNPGYVDYGDNGDNGYPRGSRAIYPSNNGFDFYRGVSRQGNGSYDNPTYSETDSSSYRIPRPTAAHARNDDQDDTWQF